MTTAAPLITWYPMAPGQREQHGHDGERWHDRAAGDWLCTRCKQSHGAPSAPDAPYTGSEITQAIANGLGIAERAFLGKPYDVAICAKVALEQAGYRIVRAPRKKEA